METVGAFDAKTRLSELLERTAKGETFEITKHGRAVGRLIPPATVRDRETAAAAAERLIALGQSVQGKISREELIASIHEGHRL